MSATAQVRIRQLPKSWRPRAQRMVKPLPTRLTNRPAPADSARTAGLRYSSDNRPGITRRKSGSGFTYLTPEGRVLRDQAELHRIRSLVIPPAWKDVWISPDPRGHLQATGRDARGRKQYRYHPRWREIRDETKYSPPDRLRPGAAGRAPPHRRRPAACRTAEGQGPRSRRPAAREDADPGRQRRVRAAEPIVRPDDAEGRACRGQRRPRAVCVPRQERRGARGRSGRPPARARGEGVPRSARLRALSVSG